MVWNVDSHADLPWRVFVLEIMATFLREGGRFVVGSQQRTSAVTMVTRGRKRERVKLHQTAGNSSHTTVILTVLPQ